MRDVLILGSGAGGGPLAFTLARAGADVLVLEKGPRHPRAAYRRAEVDEVSATRRDFHRPAVHEEPHALMRAGDERSMPTDLGWIACCVGGGTVFMGSYLFRFHPDDFRMAERFGPYLELVDWPYGYAELEPYYAMAEWEMGVAGEAGANPFEGPRSCPYPLPPLDAHPLARRLEAACDRLGLCAFPTPRGINSRPYGGRPACLYCETCAGFGCAVGAKASTQEALLDRAEATGCCEIRPRAMARRVTVDGRGRASGCVYLDEVGVEHRARAKVVCVCCSAVESARLLLLSTSSRFPDGLANGGGLVGRHLQFHSYTGGMACFSRRSLPAALRDHPNPFLGRSVMDYYFLPPGVSDLGKGGLLRFGLQTGRPIATAQRIAEEGPQRLWGEPLMARLRGFYGERLTVDFEVFHDFLPNAGTYVDLDPEHTDRWGLPIARIHLDEPEHHRRAGAWLLERCVEILRQAGAEEFVSLAAGETAPILVHGTCRAGTRPDTSVLDPFCRSHEVPNLYVVDGSFMPTSGGAPPTLTILANSFRVADSILARAKAGEFGS